jgi:anti-sigma-K factor RskA
MICEALRDHYELFVLGSADEAEAGEIRTHLNRNCVACAAGVKSARELTALLGTTAPIVSPRAELRRRVMASVAPPAPALPRSAMVKRGFPWGYMWAAVATLAAVFLVHFDVRIRQETAQSARLRGELNQAASANAQRTAELARLNQALAIVNSAEVVEVAFGPNQQPKPTGKVFVSPQQGVLLIASRLPAAPAGKIYEMWIVPRQGAPAPAGLFQSGPDGVALHLRPGPIDLNTTGAVAVTLENEGGAAAPTMQILIAAALPPRATR